MRMAWAALLESAVAASAAPTDRLLIKPLTTTTIALQVRCSQQNKADMDDVICIVCTAIPLCTADADSILCLQATRGAAAGGEHKGTCSTPYPLNVPSRADALAPRMFMSMSVFAYWLLMCDLRHLCIHTNLEHT